MYLGYPFSIFHNVVLREFRNRMAKFMVNADTYYILFSFSFKDTRACSFLNTKFSVHDFPVYHLRAIPKNHFSFPFSMKNHKEASSQRLSRFL